MNESASTSQVCRPGAGVRQTLFRCVRLILAAGVLLLVGFSGWKTVVSVDSEQAYINADITALRAPIGGQLHFEPVEPGERVLAGTPLFRVENPRFGNLEAAAQLNWVQELVERLRLESNQASLRHERQEEIFKHHAALFAQKLIPRLEYLEEETKLELSRTAMTDK